LAANRRHRPKTHTITNEKGFLESLPILRNLRSLS
jgi:hypothetical protein